MKKKGFTLVELLAVIVILAVISLIATPMILNVIEKVRKGAAVQSVNGIISAAEKQQVEGILTGNVKTKYEFPSDTTLKYDGEEPENGILVIDQNKNISVTVKVNGYCVRKNYLDKAPEVVSDEICEQTIYSEELLNGADPVLGSGLVPVQISNTGIVTYADTETEWYNYGNSVWANAVVLVDSPSKTYNVGDVIQERDIKQYYVWIPRYRYQLWNVNSDNTTNVQKAINIEFENKETQVSNGTANGEWLTHPAFTSFDTNGIWVGKFETSYDEETFTNSSLFLTTNYNNNAVPNLTASNVNKIESLASNIIIKPNVRNFANKSTSTFYTLGRNVNSSLNSHMMKNTEWGAVAYLTYSNYGKCDGDTCEEVVYNNANNGYKDDEKVYSTQYQYGTTITGCSAESTSSKGINNQGSCAENYAWNEKNNKASTTGNISGIYDMAGGTSEYVMAVLVDSNSKPLSGRSNKFNSGYNGTFGCPTCDSQTLLEKTNGIDFPTDSRYYDLYVANSLDSSDVTYYKYTNSKLGDAMKEVTTNKTSGGAYMSGSWFKDTAAYPVMSEPWIVRGGSYSSTVGAGLFSFTHYYGYMNSTYSFRVVLAF